MARWSLSSLSSPATCAALAASFTLGAFGGCSSSSTSPGAGDAGVGGPVVGELDDHCSGVTPVAVNPSACHGSPGDAGMSEEDAGVEPVPPTRFNDEADDDDCKFHVKFAATPAPKVNGKVTFTLTVIQKADGMPATGAIDSQGNGIAIEGGLVSSATHVLPNTSPPTTVSESPAGSGVYKISPVQFDSSGRWELTFHLYESCSDSLPDSQHGHVSFFFDVP